MRTTDVMVGYDWATEYGFTGQRLDASASLMYYGARYYDTTIGRFIQPDSFIDDIYNPQSLNHYSYVNNNPVRYTDPTGHYNDCGDDCSDEDKALSDNVPAIVIIADTIHDDLKQDFGTDVGSGFSIPQLRTIESALYRFADVAGGLARARRATAGLKIEKGMTGAYQFFDTIYLNEGHFSQQDFRASLGPQIGIVHELAHYWDWTTGTPIGKMLNLPGTLSGGLYAATQGGLGPVELGPTLYARSADIREDWAESVTSFVYPEYIDIIRAENSAPEMAWPGPGLRPLHLAWVASQFGMPRGDR